MFGDAPTAPSALEDPSLNSIGSNISPPETTVIKEESKKGAPVQHDTSQFPPPKTDKPRPHVCGTCGRSFARLEHLKRHERSHTKEKPFECQECSRCFARRDLLLRHQQKLHYQNNPASRPKNGRRESVTASSNGTGRVRKNSVANSNVGGSGGVGNTGPRPRANTIGHLDLASLGLVDNDFSGKADNAQTKQFNVAQHRMSMSNAQRPTHIDLRGLSSARSNQQNPYGLSKLNTHIPNLGFNEPLRTAPAYLGFTGFDMDQLFTPGGNTVNPAQLHLGDSVTSPHANFLNFPSFTNALEGIEQDDEFTRMRNWDTQMQGMNNNDAVFDESSPSRFSSNSQSGYSETVIDGSNGTPVSPWVSGELSAHALLTPGVLSLDALGSGLPNIDPPPGTLSPQNLFDAAMSSEPSFDAMLMQSGMPDWMNALQQNQFPPTSLSNFGSDSPSISSSSMTGSARQSSVTSVSTDSITDATRQALLLTLSQPSVFGHTHRKFSQPSVSSPLSPRGAIQGQVLPSTADLQRYINAYVQYFHPHLPFLHVPTLYFDSPDYITNLRSTNGQTPVGHAGIVGGGGCLILAMGAIGALYEYDHQASRDLFESAKRMIQLYLEERRKADMSAAVNGQSYGNEGTSHNTPLWLVQAMLLNVVYGHFSGDKTAADIASTHCAALVSLARAAELAQPPAEGSVNFTNLQAVDEVKMEDGVSHFSGANSQQQQIAHAQWLRWKEIEERKRTLFAVFILSSLLVTAYNQTPAIMNSEVLLDLPCEEDLWTAESSDEWMSRGGFQAAEASALPFSHALGTLLAANQRHTNIYGYGSDLQDEPQLKPSTFGCLVLINALHNYIWETRSRHQGRQWTAHETESMFSHIEPALNAWQAAWKANDHHRLQRPNPFGFGPLGADSIPLLDLAFMHLFVNLGRVKEAFWQRDFDAMSEELAHGIEIIQHADGSPERPSDRTFGNSSSNSPLGRQQRRTSQIPSSGQSSKRERHLRKAAFYAADSLTISSKCNLTFADASSHELPIQSAMCFFTCAQVLAEWACTVQERVGRYLGVLGATDIDYTQVPAIMLLETEDVELLGKMEKICAMLEDKMIQQANILAREFSTLDPSAAMSFNPTDRLQDLNKFGLGSRILRVTGFMLEKAAVWPVTHVMAGALEMQASHMNRRAVASVTAGA